MLYCLVGGVLHHFIYNLAGRWCCSNGGCFGYFVDCKGVVAGLAMGARASSLGDCGLSRGSGGKSRSLSRSC